MQTPPAEGLSPSERAVLADRLAAERAATTLRATELASVFDGIVQASTVANVDDEHDPEGATVGFERAQVAALLDQAWRHLVEVDDALERLRAGRYGTCARCGKAITVERLTALPATVHCVACAQASPRSPPR